MTKKVINQVQDYLTVVGEDRVYQIVNVELLLRRHPPDAVIAFPPQDDYKIGLFSRHMTPDDENNHPLISYYRGL